MLESSTVSVNRMSIYIIKAKVNLLIEFIISNVT